MRSKGEGAAGRGKIYMFSRLRKRKTASTDGRIDGGGASCSFEMSREIEGMSLSGRGTKSGCKRGGGKSLGESQRTGKTC